MSDTDTDCGPGDAEKRLANIRLDPQFPGQTYDQNHGRWCHTAEDLYRWLTRPNEDPRDVDNIHGYPLPSTPENVETSFDEHTRMWADEIRTTPPRINRPCPECSGVPEWVILGRVHTCPACEGKGRSRPENVETPSD